MSENVNDIGKPVTKIECPFCYHSPAVILCALCGAQGIVLKEAAEEYEKIKDPTVDDRIRIRRKYM